MKIFNTGSGTPRIRLRDPGNDRKVKFSKTMMPQLVEIVRAEGKQRITFTDSMTPGFKAVVSITGTVVYYHQWTDRRKKQKRFDKLVASTAIDGVDPKRIRESVFPRVEKIAFGLDPNTPDFDMPTVSEFIESELEWLLKRYSKPATVKSQVKCWLLEHFKGEKDKHLNQLTRKDVIKFIEWVADKRSKVTACRCLSLLKVIMARAVDLQYIDRNPCQGVKKYREPDSRTRIFTDDEYVNCVKAVIRNIDHPHSKIIYLLLLIPLRFQEIAAMKWSRIELDKGTYFIPADLAKNRRARTIALNAPAIDLLTQMHSERDASNDWVFPAKSESGHTVSIRVQFEKILKEAGIDKKSFRIHDVRRSGASALLNDFDANPLKIMEILGHRSMASTMVYSRLSAKSMAATSDLLAQKFNKAVSK